jgi:hypothetical protein
MFIFNANDSVLYSSCSSLTLAFEKAQTVFNIQQNLYDLKVLLNSLKTKCIVISYSKHSENHVITTLESHSIEQVKTYKYLGVWVDEKLCFTTHVKSLVRKFKMRVGFYYWHKACFFFAARKELIR